VSMKRVMQRTKTHNCLLFHSQINLLGVCERLYVEAQQKQENRTYLGIGDSVILDHPYRTTQPQLNTANMAALLIAAVATAPLLAAGMDNGLAQLPPLAWCVLARRKRVNWTPRFPLSVGLWDVTDASINDSCYSGVGCRAYRAR